MWFYEKKTLRLSSFMAQEKHTKEEKEGENKEGLNLTQLKNLKVVGHRR